MATFTTGLAPLPDIGDIGYNGVRFSCLQHTNLDGKPLPDNANRTVKGMEWTLNVDGVVTLESAVATTIDNNMVMLRNLLSKQGGILTYSGKGFGQTFTVNKPGGIMDMAWGPVPTIFNLQPLGASRSAAIKWSVKFTIAEVNPLIGPLVQFTNAETITYDEDSYSAISIKGAMEIPLTRVAQTSRAVTNTVDTYRELFLGQVGAGIDLTRFRVTRRNFNVSADKRTMDWDFLAEELPPGGLPIHTTTAKGRFTVNPTKQGAGLIQWMCSLNCTYTIPPGQPRRMAYMHFITLMTFRMQNSCFGVIPALNNAPAPNPAMPPLLDAAFPGLGLGGIIAALRAINAARRPAPTLKAILMDFGIDEGLYLDSKSITFRASWQIFTDLSRILFATGIWRYADTTNSNLWATSVSGIQGWKGNLENSLDPSQDAIVDLGLGAP